MENIIITFAITDNANKAEIKFLVRELGAIRRTDVHLFCDNAMTLLGVKSPYHQGYIDELKIRIPGPDREWDPGARMWFINATYYNIVKELCEYVFGANRIILHNNVDECRRLRPTPRIVKRKEDVDGLTKKLVTVLQAAEGYTTEGSLTDIIEVIMDSWKDGLISDQDTLDSIYKIINN